MLRRLLGVLRLQVQRPLTERWDMQKPTPNERMSIWHAPRTLILLAILPFIYEPTAQARATVLAILVVELGFTVEWMHGSREPSEEAGPNDEELE